MLVKSEPPENSHIGLLTVLLALQNKRRKEADSLPVDEPIAICRRGGGKKKDGGQ